MKRSVICLVLTATCLCVFSQQQFFTTAAETVMKYGNFHYAANFLDMSGIHVTDELGDNRNSYAYRGKDSEGRIYIAKIQHKHSTEDLDFIAFVLDTCYTDDVSSALISSGYRKLEYPRKRSFGWGTVAIQEIYRNADNMCVVQTGNNYLSGKVYLYYTNRHGRGNKIVPSDNDISVTDFNVIYDPTNSGETDWNATEIDPDWLSDSGIYLKEDSGEYYELRPFYNLRNSRIPKADGFDERYTASQGAVGNELDPIQRLHADKSELLEIANAIKETPPVFPGGDDELVRLFHKSFKMPENIDFEGRVVVYLVVERDGKVSVAGFNKQLPEKLKDEIIRVFSDFPEFTPGTRDGSAVRVRMQFPLDFR